MTLLALMSSAVHLRRRAKNTLVQLALSVCLINLVVAHLALMSSAVKQRPPVAVTRVVLAWSSLREERLSVEQRHALTCNAARMRPIAVPVTVLQALS
jgi:hypothetical protein